MRITGSLALTRWPTTPTTGLIATEAADRVARSLSPKSSLSG
jgi:hypothetical protein